MSVVFVLVQIIFWASVAAMLHTYVLYPLSLRLLPRKFARAPQFEEEELPRVSVLVPAYNEERVIGAKTENCLALNYPRDRIEILIGSDGSRDRTNEIVRSFAADSRLRLVELPGRSGKTGVYNRLVAEATGEIIVFTDANVMLDGMAVRNAVRHFADPKVGVVNGGKYIQIPRGAESVGGEALYGNYENRLRTRESEVGGMSGALGSLMAMRRSLYRPYARGSTNDDTVPSIWAVLDGYRQVHDSAAKAYEESGANVTEEYRRRIRIGAGNFQTLFRYPQILLPRHGIAAYTFFSHKVLRWIFPFLMIAALAANAALLPSEFYRALFILQLAGYAVAGVGGVLNIAKLRLPLVTHLFHFVALNVAFFVGFFVYIKGIQSSAWEPTAREAA